MWRGPYWRLFVRRHARALTYLGLATLAVLLLYVVLSEGDEPSAPLSEEDEILGDTPLSAPAPLVAVIVPVGRHTAGLAAFFGSLFSKTSYRKYEVTIVAETPSAIPQSVLKRDGVRLLQMPTDKAFSWSAASNFGALSNPNADLFLFLSTRATLFNDVVARLVSALDTAPSIGIAGCRVLANSTSHKHVHSLILNDGYDVALERLDRPVFVQRLRGYGNGDGRLKVKSQDVVAVGHYCFMARKGTFHRIGGFDEIYTSDDHVDVSALGKTGLARIAPEELEGEEAALDFCLRARKTGFTTVISMASCSLTRQTFSLEEESRGDIGVRMPFLQTPFEERWSGFLAAIFGAMSYSPPDSRIHVVWDTFCVKCFGFSNEVVHFVTPLELIGHYSVRLLNDGDSCFCEGFPVTVQQSLRRLSRNKGFESRPRNGDITVFVSHKDPGSYPIFPYGDFPRRPDFVVGRSMFEYSKFPAEWLRKCNDDRHVDEIWVPSEFVADIFLKSGVKPSKVVVVPEAIDTYLYDPDATLPIHLPFAVSLFNWRSAATEAPEGKGLFKKFTNAETERGHHYKFLSLFKWEQRKGWEVLVEAFLKEFRANEKVSLYIVTYIYGDSDSRNPNKILSFINRFATEKGLKPPFPHIQIITESLSETDLVRLYRSVDAFAMPTHGEGWGLPIIQAMAMGLPTIATNWSGNLDFMTPQTSYLLKCKVEQVPGGIPGQMWAVPSVDHLQVLMRDLHDKRESSKRVGYKARQHIVKYFSEEAVLEVVRSKLEIIHDRVVDKWKQ